MIRTLKDLGSDYPIPENVDASVYSLITEDCIIRNRGDEFTMSYSDSSLDVSFAKGSQAIIDGNSLWLTDIETITLPSNSTFNVALRIDTSQPYGSTGSIVALTKEEMQDDEINNEENGIRDLILYEVTTGTNGVTSVADKRTIKDSYGNEINSLKTMLENNQFYSNLTTDDYEALSDDEGNILQADWRFAIL